VNERKTDMKKLSFIGITLTLLIGLALWQQKHFVAAKAAPAFMTFTVTNTNDSGSGSLRQAILDANATPGADIIDATGVTGTITIDPANYFLVITDDVTINGPGQANLTISGGDASRIFWIQNGAITIQNLTLANGFAKGGDGGGGGMGAGGAIFMHEGKQGTNPTDVASGSINLTLINVMLKDNNALGGDGGGGSGTRFGGGGMGGNGHAAGAAGGVLGSAVGYEYGGCVTDATVSTRGTNGGIPIFGSGGKEGTPSDAGFGGGGGGDEDGGFGGGGGGGITGAGAFGRGGFGGGGGNAGTDNDFLNNGGARGGFGGGGGGLLDRNDGSNGDAGNDDGQAGFGGGNGTTIGGGGMGAGGAIFVASGVLTMQNVNFQNNTANGGTGGNNGQGLGGAVFIFDKEDNGDIAAPGTTNDPQVSGCNITYSGNTASTNNNDVYGSVGSATGCVTLSIDDITQNELNSGTSVFTFTVSLSAPAGSGGVSFDIATQDNSALTDDNDYVANTLTSQAIPSGSSTYTFDVTVNGDTAVEPDENFFVNVTGVVGAVVTDGQGVGEILNDDVATVSVNVTTSPAGLGITVDGNSYTSPQTFNWVPGTNHTIATTSPQSLVAGTQYVFLNWSDGSAISHSVTAPASATTYTANFKTQHLLTTTAGTGGTISPASGYFDQGSNISINATANSGYTFSGFSGALTGMTNPQTLNLTGPASVTANFTATGGCGITVNPSTLPQPYLAVPYARILSAKPSGHYTFSVSAGQLPPGLQLVTVLGVSSIAGLPDTPGTYNFTIKAKKKGTTCEATRSYTVTIPATVLPILNCVQRNPNGTYTARFGYHNSTGAAVTIPVGPKNYFTPGNQNRGQTTVFQPGGLTNAFSVTFTKGNNSNLAIWLLKGPDGVLRPVNVLTTSIGCP
jgi:hypothetical protein